MTDSSSPTTRFMAVSPLVDGVSSLPTSTETGAGFQFITTNISFAYTVSAILIITVCISDRIHIVQGGCYRPAALMDSSAQDILIHAHGQFIF